MKTSTHYYPSSSRRPVFCGSRLLGRQKGKTVNIYSANYEEEIAVQLEYLEKLFPDYNISIT